MKKNIFYVIIFTCLFGCMQAMEPEKEKEQERESHTQIQLNKDLLKSSLKESLLYYITNSNTEISNITNIVKSDGIPLEMKDTILSKMAIDHPYNVIKLFAYHWQKGCQSFVLDIFSFLNFKAQKKLLKTWIKIIGGFFDALSSYFSLPNTYDEDEGVQKFFECFDFNNLPLNPIQKTEFECLCNMLKQFIVFVRPNLRLYDQLLPAVLGCIRSQSYLYEGISTHFTNEQFLKVADDKKNVNLFILKEVCSIIEEALINQLPTVAVANKKFKTETIHIVNELANFANSGNWEMVNGAILRIHSNHITIINDIFKYIVYRCIANKDLGQHFESIITSIIKGSIGNQFNSLIIYQYLFKYIALICHPAAQCVVNYHKDTCKLENKTNVALIIYDGLIKQYAKSIASDLSYNNQNTFEKAQKTLLDFIQYISSLKDSNFEINIEKELRVLFISLLQQNSYHANSNIIINFAIALARLLQYMKQGYLASTKCIESLSKICVILLYIEYPGVDFKKIFDEVLNQDLAVDKVEKI